MRQLFKRIMAGAVIAGAVMGMSATSPAKAIGLRHHSAKPRRIHCQPWPGATG